MFQQFGISNHHVGNISSAWEFLLISFWPPLMTEINNDNVKNTFDALVIEETDSSATSEQRYFSTFEIEIKQI